MESLIADFQKAKESFPYFIEHIFPLSFKKRLIVKAPHTFKWAKRIQSNKRTATLSARKHLKSITMYAFVMWLIFKMKPEETIDWLYMSYNQTMSAYHTINIKNLIDSNIVFKEILDLKDNSSGASQIDYSIGTAKFTCTPTGILTFNRGRHPNGVICDDILQDPTSEMNFTIIDKITRIFNEQVMSLPIEGGEVHLVGTAQHTEDLFFKLKDNPLWDWQEYKAIINEKNQEVLWPELFNYKRLCEIRSKEIGEKAFKKEYNCSPVWSESAYFQREELMKVVKNEYEIIKQPANQWKQGHRIIAGLDIGKKAHPSHLVIFSERNGFCQMIYHKFMRGWDYTKQVNFINSLKEFYLIDEIRYDDTRGEFTSLVEQGIIDPIYWKPITFSTKTKFIMAANFDKRVSSKKIGIINDTKMINSILAVNNELQAPSTEEGHGDAFWSISLALYQYPSGGGYLAK